MYPLSGTAIAHIPPHDSLSQALCKSQVYEPTGNEPNSKKESACSKLRAQEIIDLNSVGGRIS